MCSTSTESGAGSWFQWASEEYDVNCSSMDEIPHYIVLQKTPPSLECPPCSLQEVDGPCALHQPSAELPSAELAAGSRGRAKSTMLTVPWMTFLRLCSGSPVSLGFPTRVVRDWRESYCIKSHLHS